MDITFFAEILVNLIKLEIISWSTIYQCFSVKSVAINATSHEANARISLTTMVHHGAPAVDFHEWFLNNFIHPFIAQTFQSK